VLGRPWEEGMAKTPGKTKSCLVQMALLLLIALGYTGVRYMLDRTAYTRAHSAYLAGDCAAAAPVYNRLISTFRLGDLGGYAKLAEDEKIACAPFLDAAARETSGDLPGALIAFADIVQDQAGAPLSAAAQTRMAALITTRAPDALASAAVCAQPKGMVALAGLPADAARLAGLYDACGAFFTSRGSEQNAFDMYYAVLASFATHPLAEQAAAALLDNLYVCQTAAERGDDPLLRDRAGFLAALFLRCGEKYTASEDYADAARVYELFLAAYPGDPQAEEIRAALARALIADARQSGAGEIPLPEKVTGSESSGATTTVVIQNDSPEKVRLIFTGPVTRIEELGPCITCTKFYNSGPQYCPEMGPTGSYELPSGAYEVLVESVSDEGVLPFTGSWQMEGGEYYTCFFVIERQDSR
jgi:tetratricopeptide (TPR) repeat protein